MRELAQLGIVARGVIFTLMATLTGLTVYEGAGGKVSGTIEAFNYISQTIYGTMLLIGLVLGMVIYIVWRVYLTYQVDKERSRWDQLRLKANHLGIALIYCSFVLYALQLIFQMNSSSTGVLEKLVVTYGEYWWFDLIVLIIGVGVIGKGIYQFYLAYSKKFLALIRENIPIKIKKAYTAFGVIGYTARGFIYTCLGYLISRSAFQLYGNPSKSPAEALYFLKFLLGNSFLFLLAGGLFIFSLFVFIKARYRKV